MHVSNAEHIALSFPARCFPISKLFPLNTCGLFVKILSCFFSFVNSLDCSGMLLSCLHAQHLCLIAELRMLCCPSSSSSSIVLIFHLRALDRPLLPSLLELE